MKNRKYKKCVRKFSKMNSDELKTLSGKALHELYEVRMIQKDMWKKGIKFIPV